VKNVRNLRAGRPGIELKARKRGAGRQRKQRGDASPGRVTGLFTQLTAPEAIIVTTEEE